MSNHPLTGEVSNSKLAAVFDTAAAAREAAAGLVQALALHPTQVKVVTPDEPDAAIKLEPEGRGIWRTIVRSGAALARLLLGSLPAPGRGQTRV